MYSSDALSNKETLINTYIKLVNQLATKIHLMLPQGFIDKDDLIGEGIAALVKLVNDFDESKINTFEGYATRRIRGAMIDFLRKQDILPQTKRKDIKDFEKMLQQLEGNLQRTATETEILKHMDLSKEKYYEILRNTNISTVVHLDSYNYNYLDSKMFYESESNDVDLQEYLIKALDILNEKEKLILQLHFYEDLNFKEIANVMDLSNARISQIYPKIIMKLRTKINQLKKQNPCE